MCLLFLQAKYPRQNLKVLQSIKGFLRTLSCLLEPLQSSPPGSSGLTDSVCGCFQELARERQESSRLLKAHQDKDDLIGKLKEEIDLLNRVSFML